MTLSRRAVVLGAAALAGCKPAPPVTGRFAGASPERGHLLRNPPRDATSASVHRTRVVIAGGGIAGLAAARALRLRGIEDFRLLELEDATGGNSRGSELGGLACPLGAHYLPVPGDDARVVQDLLEELGLRKRVAGRWTYDERHLVHSPQERLFLEGAWHDGLLPIEGFASRSAMQYKRFAHEIDTLRARSQFFIPMALRAGEARAAAELDALTFAQWLAKHGLDDRHLLWYLDYCCRDDYGAGLSRVSAWAGVHYFAARHGFSAGGGASEATEGLLTWPEGNAWLARALARPLGERAATGRVVLRIEEGTHGVTIDALNAATHQLERYEAQHCIVALPAFVAARVIVNAPASLQRKAAKTPYAPWAVVNLHLREPLADQPGAPLAWDNVIYGGEGLGYVVATHQALDPRPGPTVISWYCAPGEAARAKLLDSPWTYWRDAALKELSTAHPDLAGKITQVEVARYGHAMAIPVPGALADAGMPPATRRMSYAHADWAGYSIFEEAFTMGHAAGTRVQS